MVSTTYRVIYGDTDQMGVVYYANYLRFAEHGRNEFIRARGMRYRELEASFHIHLPVVEAHLLYRASARYDDLLVIETSLEEIRRVSLRFAYQMHRQGEQFPLVTGYTVHACIGPDGRPTRLPDPVIRALGSTLSSAPPE